MVQIYRNYSGFEACRGVLIDHQCSLKIVGRSMFIWQSIDTKSRLQSTFAGSIYFTIQYYRHMFHGNDYPKSLDESLFNAWLVQGRQSKISYNYLIIVWDDLDAKYTPVYTENRNSFSAFELYGEARGREALVAIYDLYSEARIS